MRRSALAILLTAALWAPAAQASSPTERAALRQALQSQPRAAGARALPLPLPAPPRAGAAAASREAAQMARDRGPGPLLVGLRTHADAAAVTHSAVRLGATVTRIDTVGVLSLQASSVAKAAAVLRRHPGVAYVERDRTLSTADAFDTVDPATGIPYTWAFNAVHAGDALAAAGGGSKRQVAVIDTGIDAGHPDLAGHVGKSLDTASGGSGVNDFVGHGTFVSGLIAASGGNGGGGRGVAGNTTLFPVRGSVDGSFSLTDLLRGLDFAITSGADIVNMSLAGDGFSESAGRALDAVFLNNVLPVAAVGNRAEEGNPLEYPAAAVGGFRGGEGIGLAVAAVRPDGRAAFFSAHNDFVSLSAPGADQSGCAEGVFSTIPHDTFQTLWDEPGACNRVFSDGGGRYAYAEGTSFAAPIAAGIAALAWQVEPQLASEQVGDVLNRSAHQTLTGGRWNEYTGRGVVDGRAAVAMARVYDTTAPRPRGRAKRKDGRRVAVTLARVRDRTRKGHRLAGGLSYALLSSTTNGRTFSFAAKPRSKPFRKTVRLAGTKRHLLVVSVCDANGNCASKRLGRFRRR